MRGIKNLTVLFSVFILIGLTSKAHAACVLYGQDLGSYFANCTSTTTSNGAAGYYSTPNGGKLIVDYNYITGLYKITAQGSSTTLNATTTSGTYLKWINDNIKELYKTLYTNNGDISGQVMGLQTAQRLSFSGFTDHIITHTAPNEKKKELGKQKTDQDMLTSFLNSLALQLEYDSISINQVGGNAYNAVYGFKHQQGKWEFGFDVPFSYAYLSDYSSASNYSGSKGNLVGLNMFTTYTLIEAPFTLKIGVDAIGSLYTTQNPLYRLGTVNYGGGPLVSIFKSLDLPGKSAKSIFSTLDLSAGISYQLSTTWVPTSMFTNDSLLVRNLADIVEDRPLDKLFTYGFNVGLPIKTSYALNFEAVRSNNLSASIPSGYGSLTALGARGSWYPVPTLELNLGYRTIQDIDTLTSHGIILGGKYVF